LARRIIDLSFSIREGMTRFPVSWHPVVEITQLGRLEIEGRETRKLVLGTHTGTHVDAPRHFIAGLPTIDEILLDQIVGPATVCDFSDADRFQELEIADFERVLGSRPVERIINYFGWSDHFEEDCYYSDHPFISEEAAQWLVDQDCRMLAMDTPMPDNPVNGKGCSNDSPNHKILLGNGVVLVEYLTNLKSLKKDIVEIVVAPLKIEGADGSPARVFAMEED
jgi:arylformamidase